MLAGVGIGTVYVWRQRAQKAREKGPWDGDPSQAPMPEPYAKVQNRRPVWKLSEIEDWLKATNRHIDQQNLLALRKVD